MYCNYVVSAGDAGETKQQRSRLRHQGAEEGHHPAGRRRRVHHDGEACAVAGPLSPVPHAALLLFPNTGQCRMNTQSVGILLV